MLGPSAWDQLFGTGTYGVDRGLHPHRVHLGGQLLRKLEDQHAPAVHLLASRTRQQAFRDAERAHYDHNMGCTDDSEDAGA